MSNGLSRYQHLERRRLTWYARVEVPPSLRRSVGKKRLIQSLKTRDLHIANVRKWEVVARLKQRIADAGKQPATGEVPYALMLREKLASEQRIETKIAVLDEVI